MRCLRIPHHLKIYSIFAFLLFSFFLSVGISQNSYATSVTCNLNFTLTTSTNGSNIYYQNCDTSSLSTSVSDYFITEDVSLHLVRSGTSTIYFSYNPFYFNTSFTRDFQTYWFYGSNSGSAGTSFDFSRTYYYTRPVSNFNKTWGFTRTNNIDISLTTFSTVITISDEPFISEPEPCPICPEIPENPYDDKFDNITRAIYCCGAVLIMLYFFFCIYKIIVKDGGSRR